jgi:hypothetical protein
MRFCIVLILCFAAYERCREEESVQEQLADKLPDDVAEIEVRRRKPRRTVRVTPATRISTVARATIAKSTSGEDPSSSLLR